jgi:lysophospholipid acyltransferase (LPLAT)-like uncharacterized protein
VGIYERLLVWLVSGFFQKNCLVSSVIRLFLAFLEGFFWSAKCCAFNKSFTFAFHNLSPILTSFWLKMQIMTPFICTEKFVFKMANFRAPFG